jgi:CheY-like chemotaxis protein
MDRNLDRSSYAFVYRLMPPHALNNLTIVLVEDHADARALIGRFLRQEGANVISAGDGLEALEAVKTHHPDLVLSDLLMPRRDGFELLHDIRSLDSSHGGSIPVIAMTALVPYPDRQRSDGEGFETQLAKPFSPKQLLDAILSVVKR